MWRRIKRSMYRFMQGRYGFDSLSNFMLSMAMGVFIINLILSFTLLRYSVFALVLSLLAWGLLILSYIRVFSKNYAKRNKENEWFVQKAGVWMENRRKAKARQRIRRTHRIYSCPGCRQKIKIPKGKGRVVITCPKCRMEFTKKT